MRWMLPLLLLLGGCGGCASVPSHTDLRATTLRLEFEHGLCSGTAIGRDLVMTATHCLQAGKLRKINDGPATATVVRKDRADIVILRVSVTFEHVANRGPLPNQGDRLRWWGNPKGVTDVYREGYVARVWTTEIVLDAMVCMGDSGAGLFDARGRVVGVVSAVAGRDSCHFGLSF